MFRPCNSDGSLKSLSIGRLPLFLLPPLRNILVETTRLSCKVSQSLGFAHSILVVILNVPYSCKGVVRSRSVITFTPFWPEYVKGGMYFHQEIPYV